MRRTSDFSAFPFPNTLAWSLNPKQVLAFSSHGSLRELQTHDRSNRYHSGWRLGCFDPYSPRTDEARAELRRQGEWAQCEGCPPDGERGGSQRRSTASVKPFLYSKAGRLESIQSNRGRIGRWRLIFSAPSAWRLAPVPHESVLLVPCCPGRISSASFHAFIIVTFGRLGRGPELKSWIWTWRCGVRKLPHLTVSVVTNPSRGIDTPQTVSILPDPNGGPPAWGGYSLGDALPNLTRDLYLQ